MPMVEIEKPVDEPLGDWFEALRGWLDRNGCRGVTFARVGRGDRPIYRLAFDSGALAEKFSRTFPTCLRQPAGDSPEFVATDTLGDAAQGASSRRA